MISEQHGIPVLQASWQTTPGIVLLSSTSLRKRFAVHPDHLHELGGYVAEGPALLLGIPWPFALRATVRVMLTVHGDVARLSPLARRLRTEHATLHLYRNALELGETAIRAWCAKASRQR